MLFEQLRESRNRDIEGVGAIVLFQSLQFCGACDALRVLEGLDGWLRLDVDGIVESGEALLLGMVQESALLEKEGQVVLAINLDEGQSSGQTPSGMFCARDPPSLG